MGDVLSAAEREMLMWSLDGYPHRGAAGMDPRAEHLVEVNVVSIIYRHYITDYYLTSHNTRS